MSTTQLYIIKKSGKYKLYKEFPNSHRGAMLLWSNIYDKYLKYKDELLGEVKLRYKYFNVLIDEKPDKFWRLDIDNRLPRELRLMLASTYDHIAIKRENLINFAEAIERIVNIKFFEDIGHWKDYPKIFRELANREDIIGIIWNQTSVNADPITKNYQFLYEYLDYMEKKYNFKEK